MRLLHDIQEVELLISLRSLLETTDVADTVNFQGDWRNAVGIVIAFVVSRCEPQSRLLASDNNHFTATAFFPSLYLSRSSNYTKMTVSSFSQTGIWASKQRRHRRRIVLGAVLQRLARIQCSGVSGHVAITGSMRHLGRHLLLHTLEPPLGPDPFIN